MGASKNLAAMAFSYDQIIEAMGTPDREESLEYPANQLGRRYPPTPRFYLFYRCGCRYEMKSFGGGYLREKTCSETACPANMRSVPLPE
jgi:hypothetical protein